MALPPLTSHLLGPGLGYSLPSALLFSHLGLGHHLPRGRVFPVLDIEGRTDSIFLLCFPVEAVAVSIHGHIEDGAGQLDWK